MIYLNPHTGYELRRRLDKDEIEYTHEGNETLYAYFKNGMIPHRFTTWEEGEYLRDYFNSLPPSSITLLVDKRILGNTKIGDNLYTLGATVIGEGDIQFIDNDDNINAIKDLTYTHVYVKDMKEESQDLSKVTLARYYF